MQGYSPLAKGRLLLDPVVCSVARRHRRSPAQVLVRWSLQKGVAAIPKSTHRDRVRENAQVRALHVSVPGGSAVCCRLLPLALLKLLFKYAPTSPKTPP